MSGTNALQLQLAYTLHRVDVWYEHTALRVVAVMPTADLAAHDLAYQRLDALLEGLRIDADVTVLAADGNISARSGGA